MGDMGAAAYRGCPFPQQLEARAMAPEDKSAMELAYERGPRAMAALDEDMLDQLRLLDLQPNEAPPATADVAPLGCPDGADSDPDADDANAGGGGRLPDVTDDIEWRASM